MGTVKGAKISNHEESKAVTNFQQETALSRYMWFFLPYKTAAPDLEMREIEERKNSRENSRLLEFLLRIPRETPARSIGRVEARGDKRRATLSPLQKRFIKHFKNLFLSQMLEFPSPERMIRNVDIDGKMILPPSFVPKLPQLSSHSPFSLIFPRFAKWHRYFPPAAAWQGFNGAVRSTPWDLGEQTTGKEASPPPRK